MTATFQTFVDSPDPQQLAFVQSVTSTRRMPGTTTRVENLDMAQSHGHGAVAKSGKHSANVKNAKGKNTRPLNSFMGFRCYYSVLFEDFEQKVISTYIVFLWERDPCKAKWALAAKAYSVIRDQVGKEYAPLDVFLMLVANLLDIVEPQDYLAVMGWEIAVDEVGTVSLVKNDAMEIDNKILRTNISVEDIIDYACELGYAGSMGSIVAAPSGKPLMAMAASSQLASVKRLENNVQDDQDQISDSVAVSDVANDQPEAAAAVNATNNNLTLVLPATQNTGAVAIAQPTVNLTSVLPATQNVPAVAIAQPTANLTSVLPATQNVPAVAIAQPTVNLTSVLPATQNVPALTTAQPTAAHVVATNRIQSVHPFKPYNILDFDPDVTLPIFEPTEGDAWDVFDIAAWIHEDAYAA